jgi:dGTPase
MKWITLFSERRLGDKKGKGMQSSDRSNFEKDYDRVVFSSAFRRLQDKTQVIPLPESDFVHTRLTHSLEVSCVGRSLGKIVGKEIIKRNKLDKIISVSDFGAIVATACLAHDIGNPPFGHSGESAISNYFRNGKGRKFKEKIKNKDKWSDLINFEGNANGFKMLTGSRKSVGGGIKLTYTTLASFVKYPTKSFKKETEKNKYKNKISFKKYGYFQTDKDIFCDIFEELGINKITGYYYSRHPNSFLVEASDDICYRIMDFEDGIRIGLIPFSEGEELLKGIVGYEFDAGKYSSIKDKREKIGYLRAKAINKLINECSGIFLDVEKNILNGKFDESLIDKIKSKNILYNIENISIEKVYKSTNVIQIETAGFKVVGGLLEMFIEAVNDLNEFRDKKKLSKEKPLSRNLIDLMPEQFLTDNKQGEELYERILQVCEFVAGMTDSYAVMLYKRLQGIELAK